MKSYTFYGNFKENDNLFFPACVYKIKRKPKFCLVYLRHNGEILTTALRPELCKKDIGKIKTGMYIEVWCTALGEFHSKTGLELNITDFNILSAPDSDINAAALDTVISPSEEIEIKNLLLLNGSFNYIYKFRNFIQYAFRDFMIRNGFTEINSPIIVSSSEEKTFGFDYFGKDACLASSPILRLIPCAAAFERVFELTHSINGKRRGSTRHLNEFISMSFVQGYIEGLDDIIKTVSELLDYIIKYISDNYKEFLAENNIELPNPQKTLVITAENAFEILGEKQNSDLNPTQIQRLCGHYKEDFIFVKDFLNGSGNFYTREINGKTKRFRLLYGGMSVASGSENIYDYAELLKAAEEKGVPISDFSVLSDALKYSVMPYGSAQIGLERLVMKLLGLSDIRRAAIFPRDPRHCLP